MVSLHHAVLYYNYLVSQQAYQLKDEQVAVYKKAFDILDKDKNGTISTSELGAAMRSIGLNPNQRELKEMVQSVDADKSGTLDFDEFKTLMIREVNKSEMEEIRREFRATDTNNDGYITVKEARAALRKRGVKDKDIEECLKQMFKGADFDHDNKLTYEGQNMQIQVWCLHGYVPLSY